MSEILPGILLLYILMFKKEIVKTDVDNKL